MVYLAGDIGGTKTHLALFQEDKKWLADKKFHSAQYKSLLDIVQEFAGPHSESIETACFGIAGPVQENICRATNLPWVIDGNEIGKVMGIPKVTLLNDLEANAYGIEELSEEEFFVLNKGEKQSGNRALISAGTGLGEAGIYCEGKKYHPFSSEGGHSSFAPENELEISLLNHLKKQYDHVSFERLLSGDGLENVYQIFSGEKDSAKAITEKALARTDSDCTKALDAFVEIYGSEAGNLALKMLSVGGLYIGGGIAPKILSAMKDGRFMKRFTAKGRFSSLLSKIPVKIILNENTALLGAGRYAQENS